MGGLSELGPLMLVLAVAVVLLAGFVKGAVGFAMPMIMVSGLGSFLPAEVALAALILPTLVTNLLQAFRQGIASARASLWRFRVLAGVLFVTILASAQLVAVIPERALLVLMGVMIAGFAAVQLAGWRPRIGAALVLPVEVLAGLVGGFFGGLTGVWGPPTILYLTALDVPKTESVRVQGVMYLLGSVVLVGAHLRSGVLNGTTVPLSALMVLPALAGQALGLRLQDRMNQALFRRATLAVLVIAGLNLLRRGIL